MSKPLQVDSACVGVPWNKVTKRVTWRNTTNYAAATGDMNPLYVDDEREGGIMAPPMFAVTLGWPVGRTIREHIDIPWPDEVFRRDVHYTEYIEFHRPIRPGDDGLDLVIQPEIHAVVPQRAGTNVIYKYDVRGADGTPYHTEYNGTMLRGVACPDGGRGAPPPVPEARPGGEPVWREELYIRPEQTYLYDAATDIVFPIHTSPKYAHSVDLPDIVLTGTITIALGVREVVNRALAGDAARVRAVGAKLTALVFPGTTITVELLEERAGARYTEYFFRILNQEGAVALNKGYLKAETA